MPEPEHIWAALIAYDVCRRALVPEAADGATRPPQLDLSVRWRAS